MEAIVDRLNGAEFVTVLGAIIAWLGNGAFFIFFFSKKLFLKLPTLKLLILSSTVTMPLFILSSGFIGGNYDSVYGLIANASLNSSLIVYTCISLVFIINTIAPYLLEVQRKKLIKIDLRNGALSLAFSAVLVLIFANH